VANEERAGQREGVLSRVFNKKIGPRVAEALSHLFLISQSLRSARLIYRTRCLSIPISISGGRRRIADPRALAGDKLERAGWSGRWLARIHLEAVQITGNAPNLQR